MLGRQAYKCAVALAKASRGFIREFLTGMGTADMLSGRNSQGIHSAFSHILSQVPCPGNVDSDAIDQYAS